MCILYYYNNTVAKDMDNRGNMLLQIDHHSGVPIYRQVIEQVRRQIMAGQLPAGQQLMSVRDLAGQLKVNPMTISKAYTMLEMEGLLERRRGVGLFIAKVRKDQKSQTKTKLLEQVLSRAVATAIQLDIPEEQVHELTERLFEKHGAKARSDENEQP
jgi:GntR family transcriptional regulator